VDVAILIGILIFAVGSFALQKLPVDVTALATLALLLLFRLVTPEQAISGFSNEAVVTVLLMFILSSSLVQSGVVTRVGHRIAQMSGRSAWKASALLIVGTGVLSAFINNTAAVALSMPLGLLLAKHYRFSPSKILMPLSFASIFGGMCTLIGTSTNLLVSSMAAQRGLPRFGMFEFFAVGGVLFALGMAYNVFVMKPLLPARSVHSSLTHKYQMSAYLTEVRVPEGSRLVGKTVVAEEISERFRLNVVEILRGPRKISIDLRSTALEPDDILLVRGTMEDILSLKQHFGLLLLSEVKLDDSDLNDESNILMELQLTPMSQLTGQSLKRIDFRKRFACFVLALDRTGELIHDKLALIPLKAWDTLLVFGPRARVEALVALDDFTPLQELDVKLHLHRRWWLSAAVIPGVMVAAATGVLPLLTAAILAVVLLLVLRVFTIQEAYKAVDWTVIFLLAAILPLGLALENTGLAALIGHRLAAFASPYGPTAVLALVVLATMVLTEFISNNSAAVLMVPVAFSIAGELGVDPKPFMMGVAYAASMSFLTPIGYQTNTMVYGPGAYRFTDYTRAGAPLALTFWVVTSLLIPLVWPF
jgi:di/tricarboxylate transporter